MRSADITAAATWGGSTQVSEDEGLEDGYPSDGILQVEEEEEVGLLDLHFSLFVIVHFILLFIEARCDSSSYVVA